MSQLKKISIDNMQRTFSSKILFILLATSFYYSVSLNVKCVSTPSSWHSCNKGILSPLSEWSILIFLFVLSLSSSSTSQTTSGLPLCASWYMPNIARVIIYKRYKVVITSNICHLGRSLDICVNIIQNPLGAVSRDPNLILVFFLMTQCSQNFNLQVLAPFNKSCAKAYKDFSLVCSNLICQSWV